MRRRKNWRKACTVNSSLLKKVAMEDVTGDATKEAAKGIITKKAEDAATMKTEKGAATIKKAKAAATAITKNKDENGSCHT